MPPIRPSVFTRRARRQFEDGAFGLEATGSVGRPIFLATSLTAPPAFCRPCSVALAAFLTPRSVAFWARTTAEDAVLAADFTDSVAPAQLDGAATVEARATTRTGRVRIIMFAPVRWVRSMIPAPAG